MTGTELTERRREILFAINEEYIRTAEPVGSKAICEKYMPGISSATVRNEMAALTEMGYIEQPHTSAGRIPSELGYRCYVNAMSQDGDISDMDERKVRRTLSGQVTELEKLLEAVSRQISEMTRLVTVTTMPCYSNNRIKRFELISVDDYAFALVVVTKSGIVKNKVFRTPMQMDEIDLSRISSVLNRRFSNLSVDRITLPVLLSVRDELADFGYITPPLLKFIYETVESMGRSEVVITGASKVLDYPEFSDTDTAKAIFSILDDKDELRRLLRSDENSDSIVRTFIGNENKNPHLRNSAMVIGNYKIGGKTVGSICVIGPTRLNYSGVIAKMEHFTLSLNAVLEESFRNNADIMRKLLGDR